MTNTINTTIVPINIDGSEFEFELCRKETRLGRVVIDQLWMPQRGLYGERGVESPNRQAVVDSFWALCVAEGTALTDRGPQESYILASLLPHARSNGSRRVFVDASLTRDEERKEFRRTQVVAELDLMLQESKSQELSLLQFNRQTAGVLGPPVYEEQVWNCYREYAVELLSDTCTALAESGTGGLQLALERWRGKMNQIGRRAGHAVEKSVLDILSYECRTAFHRCYAQAWMRILAELESRFLLCDDPDSILFHRLWHLDQIIPSNETPDAFFHLFHGHIFGLHPAAGDFICTPTGSEMVGEVVRSPSDTHCQQRFLHGLMVAIYDYARRNQVWKELRKHQSDSNLDVDAFEGYQVQRSRGRRRNGRRASDAR